MRVCILIPTLQGNCGVVWSVAFLRPLHPTDTWTKAAGRSLLLRFGSSKADLETRNQVPSGNVEVVPGKLGGRGERRKSREVWADEQGHLGWSFWGPFGQLHIRCVNCPHRSTQGQGSQTLARGSLSGRRTVLGASVLRASRAEGVHRRGTQRRKPLVCMCSFLRPFLPGGWALVFLIEIFYLAQLISKISHFNMYHS